MSKVNIRLAKTMTTDIPSWAIDRAMDLFKDERKPDSVTLASLTNNMAGHAAMNAFARYIAAHERNER